MNDMIQEYDAAISLGGFCGAATQMRFRGIRTCSWPFDWVFMEDESTIRWLCSAFADGFSTFMLKENLEPLEFGSGAVARYRYRDRKSGYCFIHHFHRELNTGGYEQVRAVMDRRLKRFLSAFAPGKRVLLVLATRFAYDPSLAVELLTTIRRCYPETTVDLHVVQFNADFGETGVLSQQWDKSLPFAGARHARDIGEYDNSVTSTEWAFLDRIYLRGVPSRQPRGLTRIVYKIWKSVGKSLRDRGYACLGFRFNRQLRSVCL